MDKVNLVLIKKRRKEMRITLQEMALELGFKNASNYYKYENGDYKFDATHLPIVAKKLKLKVRDLFFEEEIAKIAN